VNYEQIGDTVFYHTQVVSHDTTVRLYWTAM